MVSGLDRSLLELRCCPAQDVIGELKQPSGVVPDGVSPVPSTSDSKLNMPAEGVWMGTPATSLAMLDAMPSALDPSEFVNAEETANDVGRVNLGVALLGEDVLRWTGW